MGKSVYSRLALHSIFPQDSIFPRHHTAAVSSTLDILAIKRADSLQNCGQKKVQQIELQYHNMNNYYYPYIISTYIHHLPKGSNDDTQISGAVKLQGLGRKEASCNRLTLSCLGAPDIPSLLGIFCLPRLPRCPSNRP